MAIIADFCLVWLPAPRLALDSSNATDSKAQSSDQATSTRTSTGFLQQYLVGVPSNAFQVCAPGQQYSVVQRTAAICINGAKLFAVGFGSSLLGTGITNLIILVHALTDPAAAAAAAVDATPQLPLLQSRWV
jgi:hypothetical protein